MVFIILIWVSMYGLVIWTYFKPKESILWGRRGLYKEEPEILERAIKNTKTKALITLLVYPIVSIIFIFFIYISVYL